MHRRCDTARRTTGGELALGRAWLDCARRGCFSRTTAAVAAAATSALGVGEAPGGATRNACDQLTRSVLFIAASIVVADASASLTSNLASSRFLDATSICCSTSSTVFMSTGLPSASITFRHACTCAAATASATPASRTSRSAALLIWISSRKLRLPPDASCIAASVPVDLADPSEGMPTPAPTACCALLAIRRCAVEGLRELLGGSPETSETNPLAVALRLMAAGELRLRVPGELWGRPIESLLFLVDGKSSGWKLAHSCVNASGASAAIRDMRSKASSWIASNRIVAPDTFSMVAFDTAVEVRSGPEMPRSRCSYAVVTSL